MTNKEIEQYVLKYFSDFDIIFRDSLYGLWVKQNKTGIMIHLVGYDKYFKFIKVGQQYNINELLKGE